MASNNEAKIKFSADVSEFNNSIKEAKDETKQLNAEMRLNEATFKNTGDAAEYLANKHDILEGKLAANQKQQEALNDKIDVATQYYGEDSEEVKKLEMQLLNAETAEQKLLAQIGKVNDDIEEQKEAAEKSESALDKLTDTIDEQEKELADLKNQYANAVLEFGETSDEAQSLAGEITDLSSELSDNKTALEEAKNSADDFDVSLNGISEDSDTTLSALEELTTTIADQESELETLKDEYTNAVLEFGSTSDEAQALASDISDLSAELQNNKDTLEEAKGSADQFDASMGGLTESGVNVGNVLPGAFGSIADSIISGGIAGLVSGITDNIGELIQAAWDLANEWQESEASIATGTGLVGDELDELTNKAYEAAGAIADINFDGSSSAEVIAELNTRLGLTGDEAAAVTAEIGKFAKANGEDAVPAVDTLVNLMHRYGLETDDLPALLDKLTVAQQATQFSASDMADAVEKNAPSFKALGMDMDDALSYMMAFADYSDTTYQSAMAGTKKAVTALSDATDDVPGAFNSAIEVMQSGADMSMILSSEVGDTGKTIEQVFGKKAAQDMVDFFANSQVATGDYVGALQNCDGAMQTTYENTVTWKDQNHQTLAAIKGQFFGFATDVKSSLESTDGSVQTTNSNMSMSFVDFGNTAGTTAGDVQIAASDIDSSISNMGTSVSDSASDASDNVSGSFSGMGSNVDSTMGTMQAQIAAKNAMMYADMSKFASDSSSETVGKFDTMRQQASEKFENLRTKVQERAGVFKGNLSTFGENAKSTIYDSFENMKGKATDRFENMRSTVVSKANALRSTLSSFGDNAKSAISGAFENMKTSASNTWSNIHSTISGWISSIKGLFNFSWSLPKPKLPHINWHWNSIGGLLNIPVFDGISWYAKGGIFSNPSVIGVGEAGDEAVVPLDTLWSKLDALTETIRDGTGGGEQVITFNIYASDNMDVNQVAKAVEARLVRTQKQRASAWT